jgi:hypothetical protein
LDIRTIFYSPDGVLQRVKGQSSCQRNARSELPRKLTYRADADHIPRYRTSWTSRKECRSRLSAPEPRPESRSNCDRTSGSQKVRN